MLKELEGLKIQVCRMLAEKNLNVRMKSMDTGKGTLMKCNKIESETRGNTDNERILKQKHRNRQKELGAQTENLEANRIGTISTLFKIMLLSSFPMC